MSPIFHYRYWNTIQNLYEFACELATWWDENLLSGPRGSMKSRARLKKKLKVRSNWDPNNFFWLHKDLFRSQLQYWWYWSIWGCHFVNIEFAFWFLYSTNSLYRSINLNPLVLRLAHCCRGYSLSDISVPPQ